MQGVTVLMGVRKWAPLPTCGRRPVWSPRDPRRALQSLCLSPLSSHSPRSTIEGSSRSSPTFFSWARFPLVFSLKINARIRASLPPPCLPSSSLFLSVASSSSLVLFPFPPSLAQTIFIYEKPSLSTFNRLSFCLPSWPRQRAWRSRLLRLRNTCTANSSLSTCITHENKFPPRVNGQWLDVAWNRVWVLDTRGGILLQQIGGEHWLCSIFHAGW